MRPSGIAAAVALVLNRRFYALSCPLPRCAAGTVG